MPSNQQWLLSSAESRSSFKGQELISKPSLRCCNSPAKPRDTLQGKPTPPPAGRQLSTSPAVVLPGCVCKRKKKKLKISNFRATYAETVPHPTVLGVHFASAVQAPILQRAACSGWRRPAAFSSTPPHGCCAVTTCLKAQGSSLL